MTDRSPKQRAVVTNDDGVSSEGLRALALVATELDLDVTVAAPLDDASGSSAALTAVQADGRVVVARQHIDGLEGLAVFGVRAAPGFIALMAARGAFGERPDLVLSGINHGPNTGHAILHSGTVGAALTAASHGCRSMAISMAGMPPRHWETAAHVARTAIRLVLDADSPMVLNVNVPNVARPDLRGIRRATLANFGAVQTNVAEVGEGFVKLTYSDVDIDHEPGTDAALLDAGYATVTPLNPICEAHEIDLPGVELEDTVTGFGATR